ncbi:MAG: glycosyltransferase [Candidatus Bathyarchaeota archaeon]|nr:glycosyltransferase [Candidatus Bathyarchaeota archaeon]
MDGFDGARIYFSPCGIGLGHASRNMPIAQELRRRGAEIIFSTYLEGIDYTEKQGFRVLPAPPISMSNDSSGSIDLKMSSINQGVKALPTFARQVNVELRYMKAFRPDAVVSDSRLSPIFAAKLLDIPILLILNQFTPLIPVKKDMFMLSKVGDGVIMTLIGRGWGYADKILIPDFPAPNTLSIDCLRIPGPYQRKVELVGAILPKRPEEARDRRDVRAELGIADDQRLIYAGISGPRAERLPLLKLLTPIFESFPDEYRVVMSMGDPNGDSKPIRSGSLVKLSWVNEKFDLLNACDLVISRGGHETMMQSICYGKPAVIIPVANHPEQYGNARRAQELGVAHAIHQRNIDRDVLLLLIEEMLGDDSFRERLSKLNSGRLGDGVERSIHALAGIMRR